MSLEKLQREILKFVAEKYREDGSVPSTRRIINEFNLKSASRLCKMFPGCLKQICREAGVPYPAERLKLVANALKARKRSAERLERGDFDFEFERSELEAKVKELKYTFQSKTESVRDEPYWRARREQFDRLCDWIIKQLREVEPEAFKDLYRDFKKLRTHYAEIVGGLTLSDRIEEQKKFLMQLKGKCLEYQRWQDALEKRYGVPLDGMLPVIAELATAKERFGLTVEQVQSTGQFVSQMAKVGWKPETLAWYVAEHFQTLLDLDALHGEKRRIKSEIEELWKERGRLLLKVKNLRDENSNLETENRKIAEEAHALKVVRKTTAKMLSKDMELLGKADMNNALLAKMCSYGVDALVDGMQNDPRFQGMLMEASLNPSLHPQVTTFAEIVKENAEQIKQKVTALSFIVSIVEKLQGKAEGSTSSSNDEGDREKRLTPSELPTIFEPLDPRIFENLASDKYLGPRTSSVKSPQ
jgi:chromosome segregation ATPase